MVLLPSLLETSHLKSYDTKVMTCGNWTQVLEQLHSQQLPITHANYSQKETEYGAEH